MGFKFSLQGVLRVRESFERKEEQKLAVATAELKRLNAMLAKIREQLRSMTGQLNRLLDAGTTGADLHLLCFETMLLERREQALAQTVSKVVKEVHEQQARLQEARRKRQVLENLREQQLALYHLAEGRKEQQGFDDAFLLRRFSDESGKGVA